MGKVALFTLMLILVGCATTYKEPESGDVATIHFKLQEGLERGPTVSMFEGTDCKSSPYGEYIGTLWKGNWTEPSTLEFTVKVPAKNVLAFEFFNRTEFTGEVVLRGQFCRHTFAFTPESGKHYTFEYGDCEYKGVEAASSKVIVTTETTGKCHSGKYIGAY